MKTVNYYAKVAKIESDVANEIKTLLQKLDRDLNSETESEAGNIEFFQYPIVNEEEIETIQKDGTIICKQGEFSIYSAINNGIVSLSDAIGLLEGLRELIEIEN
jgi:hypothetical protein